MVLAKPFPPDIRVRKEATALISAGHRVAVLAAEEGNAPLNETTEYGLDIQRAAVPRQPIWTRQLEAATLLHKAWLAPLEQFVASFHPDALHVHDFPMVNTVLNVAERRGLPVVADLHENMPAAYRVWRTGLDPGRRMVKALVYNYHLWRWYEKRLLPRCSRIVVVVPEAAERLIEYGIDPDKVVIVSNTEDQSTFDLGKTDSRVVEQYQNLWIVSYVGGVGPHRGVDTAVKAVPFAAQHIPNLRLLIIGLREERQRHTLTHLIKKLGVEGLVELVAWQPFEKVNSYIQASEVCLVPHNDSEHTQTTIPHKLFQYMLAGKPVVVSNVRPLRRVIEDTRAGLVFRAGDPESLAQALIRLYKEPGLRCRMGRHGREAATGKYAWQHDAKRLVKLYQMLFKGQISSTN
jgi:glycosyltransferase involved in cell wall biosynthesis